MTIEFFTPESVQKDMFNSLEKPRQNEIERLVYNSTMELLTNSKVIANSEAQFYSRQLSYWYPRLLMTLYPDFMYRQLTSIERGNPYAKDFVYEMYDMVGFPKAKSHRAGDIPVVGSNVREEKLPLHTTDAAIEWDYVELRNATQLAGSSAGNSGFAYKARFDGLFRYFEQIKNEWFYFGDSAYNVSGLLTNPAVPKSNSATPWDNPATTDEDRRKDLIKAYTDVVVNSKKIFKPTIMSISLKKWAQVFGEPRSVYSDLSVLQWVKTNLPTITKIVADPFLDDKDINGNDAPGKGLIYVSDVKPDYHHMAVVMEPTALPPSYKGTKVQFPFICRTSGWNLIQAQSVNVLGI